MKINGFYMDESGNTGLNDTSAQPVLCYGGILIPSDKQVKVEQEIKAITCEVLDLIKSRTMGIPVKSFERIPFFNNYELHGKEFIDGDDFNSKLTIDERIDVLKKVFNLIKTEDLTVFVSCTNKQVYKNNTAATDHYPMYENGFKEIVNLLNKVQKEKGEACFIITDDGKKGEQDLFMQVLKNQPSDSIVYPDLQTKTSHASPLIQMADLILFITTVYFRSHYGFPARKKYNAKIVSLYKDFIEGHIQVWEYK